MVRSLVLLSLTSATLVVAQALIVRNEGSIQESAESIAGNAAPSIESLSTARAELRNFQRLLDDYVDTAEEGRMLPRGPIDAALNKIDQSLSDYLMLPYYAGEKEAFAGIRDSQAQLAALVQQCLRDIARHDSRAALAVEKQQLDPLFEILSNRILDVIGINAREARALAMEVAVRHHRTVFLGWATSGAGIAALLVVAAWSLRRTLRERNALLSARRRAELHAASLHQYSGMVAHDLLSPLQGAMLALELAERHSRNDPTLLAHLLRGRRGIRQTVELVQNLLELSRVEGAVDPTESTPVDEVASDLVRSLREEARDKGIALLLETAGEAILPMSRGLLLSLLLNLTRNAMKYMGDAHERCIWIRSRGGGDACEIEVEDTGPGIPPGLEEHIFERHVRGPAGNQPGLGLGLATVKRIVTIYHGEVGVRTGSHGGALFWVRLPMASRTVELTQHALM